MRKLTLICISFAVSVFLCNYLLNEYLGIGLLVFFVPVGIFLIINGRDNVKYHAAGLAMLSFSFGVLLYSSAFGLKKTPASELDGKTVAAIGKVISYPDVYDTYSRIDIILKTEGAPALNAILYDNEDRVSSLQPGDIIRFTASVRAADTRYGKDYDLYNAKDIFLTANIESDYSVEEGTFVSLRVISARISKLISGMIETTFTSPQSAFMKSLMIGDKSEFYSDDEHYVALSRAGLMHIIAVSGMHVAFVVTLTQLIFGAGKASSVFCMLLVWCFVFVSGATPSAVRAGIMQTVLLLAPLLKRENDPITSLSFALAVILAVNPFSCASVSLQLSFSAMAGLVLFAEKIRNSFRIEFRSSIVSKVYDFVADILSASIAVMIFSLPLTAVHFGTVAVLSPVSNILALWSVSFCFGGGYLAVISGAFIPALGKAVGMLVSLLVRYIYFVSSVVSSFRFAVVYTQDVLIALWLILTYTLIISGILSKGNTGLKILSNIAVSALVLSFYLFQTTSYYKKSAGFFSAVDVGQGQCICAISGEKTVVVDCGSSNYGLGNAGDKAASYLRSRGRDSVDYLILTHLHDDHVNGVVRLIYSIPVKNIIVPSTLDDEDGYYDRICRAAEDNGVNMISLDSDSLVSAGRLSIELFVPSPDGSRNENSMFTHISVGDYDIFVTGDAPKSIERQFIDRYDIDDVDILVVGHHGSRYSSSGEFLERLNGDIALISVGYNNYGHPTGETLERLTAYGYTDIYRTDLNGTVEVPVGAGN